MTNATFWGKRANWATLLGDSMGSAHVTESLRRILNVELPIIQAPMAGVQEARLRPRCRYGRTRIAAVRDSGHDAMRDELTKLASATAAPFNGFLSQAAAGRCAARGATGVRRVAPDLHRAWPRAGIRRRRMLAASRSARRRPTSSPDQAAGRELSLRTPFGRPRDATKIGARRFCLRRQPWRRHCGSKRMEWIDRRAGRRGRRPPRYVPVR